MAQIPSADLPVATPATGRINLEWFAALTRIAKGVAPDILSFSANGFAVSIDPPDSFAGNALQVVGTSQAAGCLCHLGFAPVGDVRLGFYIFGVYDGTARNAAALTSFSEAAWTIGVSHPANIKFETTAAGSTTRTERFRVRADGLLQFQAPSFAANGVATTTFNTNLHPVAGPQAIKEWLTFVNASGVTRYIPCW